YVWQSFYLLSLLSADRTSRSRPLPHRSHFPQASRSMRLLISFNPWVRSEPGLIFQLTDSAGIPHRLTRTGSRIPTDTGNGRMSVGIGSVTNPGRGPVITTARGSTSRADGTGSRALNGHRAGWSGVKARVISAGRR